MRLKRIPAMCVEPHGTVCLEEMPLQRIVNLDCRDAALAQIRFRIVESLFELRPPHSHASWHVMWHLGKRHPIGKAGIEMSAAFDVLSDPAGDAARDPDIDGAVPGD